MDQWRRAEDSMEAVKQALRSSVHQGSAAIERRVCDAHEALRKLRFERDLVRSERDELKAEVSRLRASGPISVGLRASIAAIPAHTPLPCASLVAAQAEVPKFSGRGQSNSGCGARVGCGRENWWLRCFCMPDKQMVPEHIHPLELVSFEPSVVWRCDACQRCSNDYPGMPHFRCSRGCDFDLCEECHHRTPAGFDFFPESRHTAREWLSDLQEPVHSSAVQPDFFVEPYETHLPDNQAEAFVIGRQPEFFADPYRTHMPQGQALDLAVPELRFGASAAGSKEDPAEMSQAMAHHRQLPRLRGALGLAGVGVANFGGA